MSWDAVRAWRDRLAEVDAAPLAPDLSPAGARAAWTSALEALSDDVLDRVAGMGGDPFDRAVYVAARTVFTAPLEWCAVLLGRGTSVHIKHPAAVAGAAPLLVETATACGLPLTSGPERDAVTTAPLVIAMGTDETVAAIREEVGDDARVLGFGHRFSVAWITDPASLPALAEDASLHDGRGCFSPVAVLSPLPPEEIVGPFGEALDTVAERWPRGSVADAEHARIRTRRSLAQVIGEVRSGDDWELHVLPAERLDPVALPRVLAVHTTEDPLVPLAHWRRWLSTVGTDDPSLQVPDARVCRPGQMQRPPVERLHDGIDWLRATLQ